MLIVMEPQGMNPTTGYPNGITTITVYSGDEENPEEIIEEIGPANVIQAGMHASHVIRYSSPYN